MKVDEVRIDLQAGKLMASIKATKYPQSTAGILWRYKSDESADGKAGEFSTAIPDIDLGLPSGVHNKYFLVEGAILNQGDDPPTPYQVTISIHQGQDLIHEAVPEEGGSGQVGKTDVPFIYRFKLI